MKMPESRHFVKIVVCHNEECRDSIVQKPLDPRPMQFVDELQSAWSFRCLTCGARRIVTKDQVGGTFGQGRRDDGTGPTTGKGALRYRPGADLR
jgi:hypothetical protein